MREQIASIEGGGNDKSSAKQYKNSLDREVFLDGIFSKYISLKGHRKTCERFYRQHAAEFYKKQREIEIAHNVDKEQDANCRLIMVPVEEENAILKAF